MARRRADEEEGVKMEGGDKYGEEDMEGGDKMKENRRWREEIRDLRRLPLSHSVFSHHFGLTSHEDVPAFLPPPPPFWAFESKEAGPALDPISLMLMQWYMCGFHTGSYLAQQQKKSSSRD
ncbi:hypothetical protein WMY93_024622 [Mugilogobius chulae]|uniref:Uncharacterized protein n=1 Tax=Mugilogobius chulae TaxID=88201 RepID=A0AAW0NB52_9GOBI